jgi:mRNA interferase RelE/StbE
MNYKLVFKPTAVKDLRKLPRPIQKRIKNKLTFFLSQNDAIDYAIPLMNSSKGGEYRFRVGEYRIVFDKDAASLIILYIEHRRDVYRKR